MRGLARLTVTREEVIAAYPVGPPAVLLAHLIGRAVEPREVATYQRALRSGATGLGVYTGIREALEAMSSHVPLGVFTGADREACSILLEATGLAGLFAATVGSDEIAHPKPDPEGIHETCRRLGVPAAETAYVGDSPRDLEAARRSGALAVAAGWGHEYAEVGPADVRASTPGDLLSLVT